MTTPLDMKDIIETRVFGLLSTTCAFSSLIASSSLPDSYGDGTPIFASSTSVTIVPANAYNTYEKFFEFGDLQKGDQDVLFYATQTIKVGDKVVLNGSTYRIKTFKLYEADGVDIVKIARLSEIL